MRGVCGNVDGQDGAGVSQSPRAVLLNIQLGEEGAGRELI